MAEIGDLSISTEVVGVAAPETETIRGDLRWRLRGKEQENGTGREDLVDVMNGKEKESAVKEDADAAIVVEIKETVKR